MGSDMAMAEKSWTPRPTFAQWQGDELVIFKDNFNIGHIEYWRGEVTDSNRDLILKFVRNIPDKPKAPTTKPEKIAHLLKDKGPISEAEAEYVTKQIIDIFYEVEEAPEREDGRVLPKPIFTKTQDKKKFVTYENCPYRIGGHQGTVCFQEGDMCDKCGWTL
jgi:hypothetical protein